MKNDTNAPAADVKTLAKNIERELEIKTSLENKLSKVISERDQATAIQRDIAYRALAARNGIATEKLDAAENTLAKADQRVISTKIALDRCTEKLADLRQWHADAVRANKRDEYKRNADVLTEEAKHIETALIALIEAKSKITERLRRMDALAIEAQIESPPHRYILKNLRHAVDQRLDLSPTWLSREARQVFSLSVDDLFRRVLSGASFQSDSERTKAATG